MTATNNIQISKDCIYKDLTCPYDGFLLLGERQKKLRIRLKKHLEGFLCTLVSICNVAPVIIQYRRE